MCSLPSVHPILDVSMGTLPSLIDDNATGYILNYVLRLKVRSIPMHYTTHLWSKASEDHSWVDN